MTSKKKETTLLTCKDKKIEGEGIIASTAIVSSSNGDVDWKTRQRVLMVRMTRMSMTLILCSESSKRRMHCSPRRMRCLPRRMKCLPRRINCSRKPTNCTTLHSDLACLPPSLTPNGLGEKKKMKMKDLILLHRMVSNLSWQAASQPDQLPLMMITSKHRNI